MIGKEVRRRRDELGLTGAQLADRAGLAPSAVSQIETGRRTPSSTSVIKLAAALNVEVGDLYPKGQAPLPLEDPAGLSDGWVAAYAAVGRELLQSWEKRAQKWDRIIRVFVNSLPEERRGEVPLSRILLKEYSDWIIDTGAVINTYVEGVLGKQAVGLDPGLDQVCDQMLRLWPRISTHGRALLRSVAGEDDPEVERFRQQLEAQGAPGFEARYREASSTQGQG